MNEPRGRTLTLVARWSLYSAWAVILILHAAGIVGYWWPERAHGFAVTSPRFWSQQLLPWVLAVACVTSLALLWRHRAVFRALVYAFPAGYLAAAVAARLLFPVSSTTDLQRTLALPGVFRWGFWMVLLGWGALLLTLAVLTSLQGKCKWAVILPACSFGLLLGPFVLWSQRAAVPSTVPYDSHMDIPAVTRESSYPNEISVGPGVSVIPSKAKVQLKVKHLTVSIEPLLTFYSRSPDRCLTALAPSQGSHDCRHPCESFSENAQGAYVFYGGDEPAWVYIARRDSEDSPLHLEAQTFLPSAVYSHLNSLCRVTIRGYRRLSLVFSPISGFPVELQEHAYPDYWLLSSGFGYLDAGGRFRWAKGAREEKGPYAELAAGALSRDAPVTMTVLDEGVPICRIALHDWAPQLSVADSPTAGWGLPANAIVPFVGPQQYGSPVDIRFQLAATGVGAGHDSVGHSAGVYRNRVIVAAVVSPNGRSQ